MGVASKGDISAVLARAGLAGLPHHMRPDSKVYQVLWADSEAARAECPARFAFTYISLCDDHLLPGWLPVEMVGGKTELEYDGIEGPDMIAKMATTLAKAGRNKGFFRKTSHYMLCVTRWAGVAVGVGQWSWTCHEGHMETITHLIERESIRCGQIGTWIAKLYCEFRRSSWAQRCRQRDPSLMDIAALERETLLIDETGATDGTHKDWHGDEAVWS